MSKSKPIVNRSSKPATKRTARKVSDSETSGSLVLTTFSTSLGWFGLLGKDDELFAVIAGHPSQKSVYSSARKYGPVANEDDWAPDIREKFEAYANGELVDFLDVMIQLPDMTAFQLSVANATRRIPYGVTVSYGELAKMAGYPRAARAVGTVMSQNRFPILIPCHRVLASGGKLGGYSSVAGVNFKARLLEIESQVSEPAPVRILSR